MTLLNWWLGVLLSVSTLTPHGLASVLFDVADDLVTFASPTAFDNLSALTATMWVNMSSAGESDAARIFNKAGSSAANAGWRFQFNGATMAVEFTVDYNTTDLNSPSTTTVSADTWTCLAVSWDGSTEADNADIYINGTEVSYGTRTDGATTRVDDDASALLLCNSSNGTRTCAGSQSDVALWNAVLTGAQIAQVCAARVRGLPLQIAPSNLILYAPLDDEAFGTAWDGDTAINRTGSGNNGTGDNGANNTGLTAGSSPLTYP